MSDFFNKPFALIRRQDRAEVLYLSGDIKYLDQLDDIPRAKGADKRGQVYDTLSALPFAQIKERGYKVRDDGAKIICLVVASQQLIALPDLLTLLPDEAISLDGEVSYDYSEAEYEQVIKNVIEQEIGNGEGANFVIPRAGRARIRDMSVAKALAMYKNLLRHERGSYWSFLFYDGERFLLGATPERHISAQGQAVKMNPISGTLRQPASRQDLLDFLVNAKEVNELFMVVDEELKMMAKLCAAGGMIIGPLLKDMANVIHTEYLLSGKSDLDVIKLLRGSMYAATVTGSPVENACNIIYKYEPEARRYYASALALLGRDAAGQDTLDSPILIRCFEIDKDGQVLTRVGSTLVRDSVPSDEVAETKAKIKSMLDTIQSPASPRPEFTRPLIASDDTIQERLHQRNQALSKFWFFNQEHANTIVPALQGKTVTIIDNEDDFCYMTKHMLTRMGMLVTVVRYTDYDMAAATADIIMVGPGPGNPNDLENNKMKTVAGQVKYLLDNKRKFIGVCLGHQVLCRALGLTVAKKDQPFQGVAAMIDFFGRPERVGFYNTFAAKHGVIPGVEFSYDAKTGDIHALRAPDFAGFQFHPESILTQHGYDILKETLISLCTGA